MSEPVRDWHVHSNCSDGIYEPAEVVALAAELGVAQMALTDHDTVAGVEPALAEARRVGIALMPAVELSCRLNGRGIHVLGYGFRPSALADDAELSDSLDAAMAADRAWAEEMCRKSCADPLVVTGGAGREHRVSVEPEELSWVRGTMQSPLQLATVLAKKLAAISDGLDLPVRHVMYCFAGRPEPDRREESYWPEVRDRYADQLARFGLKPGTRWWTPRPTRDAFDAASAVEAIARIGGLPVLAHPGEQKIGGDEIRALAACGIRGMEVYSVKHDAALIAHLEELARELGLFATAGTDYHGPYHRGQVKLGRTPDGAPLTRGINLSDFEALGAFTSRAAGH